MSEVYMFRGSEYCRYDVNADRVEDGYPLPIAGNWNGLPVTGIDAAINWENGKIYFFSGPQYYRFDDKNDQVDPGYPQPITGNWAGLTLDQVDACVNWGNGKVYFFRKDQYWRYDIAADRVDPGYPLLISDGWNGLFTQDIDGVINWGNGKAYFFRGTEYSRFDFTTETVEDGWPRPISAGWSGLFTSGVRAPVMLERSATPGQSAAQFTVKLEDQVNPQASEAAFKWKGEIVHLDVDGQPRNMAGPTSSGEYNMPSDGIQSATITSVEKAGLHRNPVIWRIASGGNTQLQPGSPQAVQFSTRLRFSLFDFNASFIKRLLFQGRTATGVELDTNLLDLVQAARLDDYSLVNTISFGGETATHDAQPPQWSGFAPGGRASKAVRVDYLQKLTAELHTRGVQVVAGYTLVERGTQVSAQGRTFRSWLSQATSSQVAAHARAIDKFFTDLNIEIDGIGFDFELNGFSGAALEQNLATLFTETSNAMAHRNGFVSYDNAPFQPNDREGSSSIMAVQGYAKANSAPNLIARPMCYNGVVTPFSQVKASIATALRDTASKGGGLHPGKVQYAIDRSRLSKDEVTRWCRDLFRPNRVGVVIYTMPGGGQAQLLKNCAEWEAALNPGEAAPGTRGQPLQVPRP